MLCRLMVGALGRGRAALGKQSTTSIETQRGKSWLAVETAPGGVARRKARLRGLGGWRWPPPVLLLNGHASASLRQPPCGPTLAGWKPALPVPSRHPDVVRRAKRLGVVLLEWSCSWSYAP